MNVHQKEKLTVLRTLNILILILSLLVAVRLSAQDGKKGADTKKTVSFKNDVFPIIEKHCLPCHAEDEFNPSELSLDNYDLLVQGGKHGPPFVAGKSSESLMIKKFSEKPPDGDRMPLNSKKKIAEGKAVWLTDEEVKTIATWIDQGGKNN